MSTSLPDLLKAVAGAARQSFDPQEITCLQMVSALPRGVIMIKESHESTYANYNWEVGRTGAVEFSEAKAGMDLEAADAEYLQRIGRLVMRLKYGHSPNEPAA